MRMQATPAPPAPPAAPQAPATTVQTTTASPTTAQYWAALRARRSELSSQLQSAQSRRDRLSRSLRKAEGADRVGLEQRLISLDHRIIQIEADIAETGRLLATAPAEVTATTAVPTPIGPRASEDVAMVASIFTICVLAPIAIALARLLWKRATAPAAPRTTPEIAQRLERLEQAVDTIAIEMERVSEGQRFMTRVLTEGNGFAALGAGQRAAEPVRVGEEDLLRVPRKGA
jgi:hypothetical protein